MEETDWDSYGTGNYEILEGRRVALAEQVAGLLPAEHGAGRVAPRGAVVGLVAGEWASTASPSRPATPTSARRTRSTSSTARRPRTCSAACSGTASLFHQLLEGRRVALAEQVAGLLPAEHGAGRVAPRCMVHSGYEASSVVDSVKKPWKPLIHAIRGIKTEGDMAPEISLENQRPAEFVFSRNVAQKLMPRIAWISGFHGFLTESTTEDAS
jgi:hypothetical protein